MKPSIPAILILGLLGGPLTADAAVDRKRSSGPEPSSQCDRESEKGSDRGGDRGGDRGSDRKSDRGPDRGWRWETSQEDWQAAQELFQQHSKRRWELYTTLDDEKQKRAIRGMIIGQYKMIQFLMREGGGELRQNKLRQIELDDEIFGLRLDLVNAAPAEAEMIRQSLRGKIAERVEKRMQERAMRIGRLEKLLQDEKKRYQADEQNKDALVEKAFEEEIERNPTLVPEDPRRRPGPPDDDDRKRK